MLDSDFDGCTARSEQKLAHFRIRLALHRIAVDGENAVAKSQSGAMGGRLRESCANEGIDLFAVAEVFDSGADSEVFRALLGAERSVFNWIEIGRVWIEDAQHPADRRLEDCVVIQFSAVNVV